MIQEYASSKWTSVLLATSQPAPPEIASIAFCRQSQPRSRLENSSAGRLLRQPATIEDSLACTVPLQQGRPGGPSKTAARLHRETRSHASQLAATPSASPGIQQAHPAWNKTALFRALVFTGSVTKESSPPLLLAEASPLQKEFPSVFLRYAQFPWPTVIF
jgi:hypothetical protein